VPSKKKETLSHAEVVKMYGGSGINKPRKSRKYKVIKDDSQHDIDGKWYEIREYDGGKIVYVRRHYPKSD
jgi:hypothetical protein